MKKTLVASLIAAGVMVAGVAVAAPDYSGFQGKGAGWYAGANVGYANEGWKTTLIGVDNTSADSVKNKSGVTYGINGGYMFNSNLGLELAYDFYSDAKFQLAGQDAYKVKNQNYLSVLSVFNVPLNQQWDAFFKVGGAYLTPKISYVGAGTADNIKPSVWAAEFVLGAGYNIMPNVQLTGQLKYINQTTIKNTTKDQLTPNYTAFTVGAVYKF